MTLPLLEADGRWAPDRSRASPVLVPLLSLGRRVVAVEAGGGTFAIRRAPTAAGGPALRATSLAASLFEAGGDGAASRRT